MVSVFGVLFFFKRKWDSDIRVGLVCSEMFVRGRLKTGWAMVWLVWGGGGGSGGGGVGCGVGGRVWVGRAGWGVVSVCVRTCQGLGRLCSSNRSAVSTADSDGVLPW